MEKKSKIKMADRYYRIKYESVKRVKKKKCITNYIKLFFTVTWLLIYLSVFLLNKLNIKEKNNDDDNNNNIVIIDMISIVLIFF